MTNSQLYLAIGVPIVINAIFNGILLTLLWQHLESRFNALNQRIDDMRDLWRSELHRVEEVFDARLKHLEEKP